MYVLGLSKHALVSSISVEPVGVSYLLVYLQQWRPWKGLPDRIWREEMRHIGLRSLSQHNRRLGGPIGTWHLIRQRTERGKDYLLQRHRIIR